MHCRQSRSCGIPVSKCSTVCSSLDCRRLTAQPPPPTPSHVAAANALSTRQLVRKTCVQVLRRLQLSRLPSTDSAAASTDAASTDAVARGGSRSSVDTGIGAENPCPTCSADCSSLGCRRPTAPPPPPTPSKLSPNAPATAALSTAADRHRSRLHQHSHTWWHTMHCRHSHQRG